MFDRLIGWIKKYAFWEGLIIGAGLCHLFYNQFWIGRLKDGFEAQAKATDAELRFEKQSAAQVKKELEKHEDYEKRFQAEAIARSTKERQLSEVQSDLGSLQKKYDGLVAMKWEEKFRSEKLARVMIEEERSIFTNRLANLNEQNLRADPHLLKRLETLSDQNRLLARERDELRKLYTASAAGTAFVSAVSVAAPKENRGRAILASLAGIASFDVGTAVIESVKSGVEPIDGEVFIEMLSKTASFDRATVVVECAPWIKRPLSENQIGRISRLIPRNEAQEAMGALVKAQNVK